MDAQIEELLLASLDDEAVLSLPLPDRIFGCHAQQAVKMLILGNRQRHALIHDIEALRTAAEDLGERMPAIPFNSPRAI